MQRGLFPAKTSSCDFERFVVCVWWARRSAAHRLRPPLPRTAPTMAGERASGLSLLPWCLLIPRVLTDGERECATRMDIEEMSHLAALLPRNAAETTRSSDMVSFQPPVTRSDNSTQ